MRSIAFIMTEMDTGGVSEALIEMLKRFDYDRYQVTLWVGHGTGMEQHRVDPRVEIRYWGQDVSLFASLKQGKPFSTLRRCWHRLLGRHHLRCNDKHAFYCVRSLPELDSPIYDYVICYQGVSPLALPNALYRVRGKERLVWIHGDLGREGEAHPFCKKLYHRFDRAIAVSQAALDLFVRQYDYPVERTAVFHNLIDREKILAQARKAPEHPMEHPAIVTVGRLSPEKGQDMIPATMDLLKKSGLDAHWYLVGDGVTREQLWEKILQYGLQDRIHLLGRKDEPFPYMETADIYVQTSYTEGWCLTVQEALLLKKPVVSTPLPAILEQITHGQNGLIAEAATPEALSHQIAVLLRDPQLRQRLTEFPSCQSQDTMERLYHIIENDREVSI